MAEHSHIEWTDATWNPITGCTMVSAGCTNCYAMTLAAGRLQKHPSREGLTRITGGRPVWTGDVRFNEQWIDQPLRWKRPRMIFVCAHGDLFHENVPDEWIDRVFAVMALAPQHTFQVLTKRPERAKEFLSDPVRRHMVDMAQTEWQDAQEAAISPTLRLPLPNVWLGTSIEDQPTADARIPHLLATPAAVRFVSAEPLLGPVDLHALSVNEWWHEGGDTTKVNALRGWKDTQGARGASRDHLPSLDWIIVGGESGNGARPMHPDWARSLRDQCNAAGVAYFFKQWGEFAWAERIEGDPETLTPYQPGKRAAGRLLDGRTWDQMPGVRHG